MIMQLDATVKDFGYPSTMTTGKRATSLGQGLVRLALAVDAAYSRAGRQLGLTAQQCELLCAVGFDIGDDGRWIPAGRGAAIGELAGALHCDQSNASRLVDRAVSRGLLARRRGIDPDGRVTLVELTDDGRRRLDEFIAVLTQTIDPLFADWPPERRGEALETLNALADALDRLAPPGAPRVRATGGRADLRDSRGVRLGEGELR
jgi:DNA-binding MarR family transcriptional regulator